MTLTKVYPLMDTIRLCKGFEVEWSSDHGVTVNKQLNYSYMLYKFWTVRVDISGD